jgi:hypothetical protein
MLVWEPASDNALKKGSCSGGASLNLLHKEVNILCWIAKTLNDVNVDREQISSCVTSGAAGAEG